MTVKDRLPELIRILGVFVDGENVQIEFQIDNGSKLQEIFQEVEKIRKWIDEINEKTQTMKRLYSESTYQVSKTMQDDMDSNMVTSTAIGLKICGALKEFEERTKKTVNNDAASRIIQLQYTALRNLYSDALTDNEAFLSKYKESKITILQRQIKLTHQSISDEECHGLIESNQLSIFVDNIEADTRDAQLALQDVESRHRELIKIENNLKEVRNMFMQMATLVHEQQNLIDTVEYFANQATDHVDLGNKKLHTGTINKTKARKKKMLLMTCLLVGLAIILIILFMT